MKQIKVIDVDNSCYSFTAERSNPRDLIFCFNSVAKKTMILKLLKHGKKGVFVVVPPEYFANIIKKRYLSFKQILRALYLRRYGANKHRERDWYVFRLLKMLFAQKHHLISDDKEFYDRYTFWHYIPFEEYTRFKEYYKKMGIVDSADILLQALDKKIKITVDNLFILHSEECSPLIKKVMDECIDIKNAVYYIGDEHKASYLDISFCLPQYDFTIDLSSTVYLPLSALSFFNSIKEKLNLPYQFKTNRNIGNVFVIKSFEKALNKLTSEQFETAFIVYDCPLQAQVIEKTLFLKNIPFKGTLPDYQFPHQLYVAEKVMISVMNNLEEISWKEVKTLIDLLRGEITEKFGGKRKLLKLYRLPVFAPKTLKNTVFFQYLIKVWNSKNFGLILQPAWTKKYNFWRYKLTKQWASANIHTGVLPVMKSANADVVMYAQYDDTNLRNIYTALTMTQKDLILTSLP